MSINGRKFIGLCLTMINENVQREFFHSVIKRAAEYNCKVLVFNTITDLYNGTPYDMGEVRVFDLIPYDILDGLIIMSETIKDEEALGRMIEKAKEHNIYTVCVERPVKDCYNISFNYRGAFEAIVKHVVMKHGCRTINVVAGYRNNSFSDERIQCCRRVLEENGLELDERRIMYGDFWQGPTETAFDEFMASGLSMPDAFICCNDAMAMTICTKLKSIGKMVPDDVIVTGFDGIPEEQYHMPRLTTAKQDLDYAGEKAVDAIVASSSGRLADKFCVIDHKIIWSQSCGCKPIDYREATGRIEDLFRMSRGDSDYDTYMFDFIGEAASYDDIGELSRKVYKYANYYGYHYYALCLDKDFMNMSASYEKVVKENGEDIEDSDKKLILVENIDGTLYDPYYDTGLRQLDKAFEKYDVFVFWSIHFRSEHMGYGVTALSTGNDGLRENDVIRHIVKYTRNLNHVLEITNSQSALKSAVSKLHDLYIHDHVTGLYNRRGFYTELNRKIAAVLSVPEEKRYLTIISVDMDGLKFINDTYGHAEGDIALKTIAEALCSIWGENEICSRFGGDEFTVASVGTDPAASEALAEKIKEYLDSANKTLGKPYKVAASFGLHSELIEEGIIVDNLIKAADDLMYKEKATHKESRCRRAARN